MKTGSSRSSGSRTAASCAPTCSSTAAARAPSSSARASKRRSRTGGTGYPATAWSSAPVALDDGTTAVCAHRGAAGGLAVAHAAAGRHRASARSTPAHSRLMMRRARSSSTPRGAPLGGAAPHVVRQRQAQAVLGRQCRGVGRRRAFSSRWPPPTCICSAPQLFNLLDHFPDRQFRSREHRQLQRGGRRGVRARARLHHAALLRYRGATIRRSGSSARRCVARRALAQRLEHVSRHRSHRAARPERSPISTGSGFSKGPAWCRATTIRWSIPSTSNRSSA